jgi:hypothetical protein
MLGKEGVDLVAQLGRQLAGSGAPRPTYWGELITKSLPRAAVGPLVDRLKSAFIRQFAAKGGASVIGKLSPSVSVPPWAAPETTCSGDASSSDPGAPSEERRCSTPPNSSHGRARHVSRAPRSASSGAPAAPSASAGDRP